MPETISSSKNNYKALFYFVVIWFAANLLQACFTGLDADEAYYWTYSRHLQWGYFDHPPMVALSIKLGELFGHGYFFTRLGTTLFSAGTIFFGFKALPEKLQNVKWYFFVFASVLIFHIYGFVVTPDSSLLFFTALFFYAYKLVLKKENLLHTIFLAFSIIGLIYSKYHGILPVSFTVLSNPKLLLKRYTWMAFIIVTAAFLPHILWQYHHDWPTVRYHLFERNPRPYKIEKTTNYIFGQLLIWGPFTTIPALIIFFRKTEKDIYLKAHQFVFWGILIFFLFSSLKNDIEPHWTLTAGISFVMLLLYSLQNASEKFKKIFLILMMANIVLIFITRILIVVPGSPAKNIDRLQTQMYSSSWADSLYKYAAGIPLVFVNSYTDPSLYQYYHPDQLSTCYSTVNYRKNNYSLSNEAALNNKTVYIVSDHKISKNDIEVKNNYAPAILHQIDSFKAINRLKIEWLNEISEGLKGKKINAVLDLFNPMNYAIEANNKLFINYTFFNLMNELKTSEDIFITEKELQPGYKKNMNMEIQLPETPGKYRLIFSFGQPFFGGTFSSRFFDIAVK